jgi:hypothetical protein
MTAPENVRQLVQRFENNLESYRSGKYNETQLRREFLDPFFEALGWDVFNKGGYAETYKDVIHEDSLEIEGENKAPDYAFRVGGMRKFFVEAKKPAVNIEFNIHPAFQLRRYAWSAKLPLGILTDFEELAIYDCRTKPDKKDKASLGRTALYSYKDYIEKWDEIAAIFSRDAVLKGSFDQYAEGLKGKKGTTEVDDAFLAEIERWRDLLAKNIALRNPSLNVRELNYAVQITIDRIIFLRICEDRGVERDEQLKEIATLPPPSLRDTSPKSKTDLGEDGKGAVYAGLCALFKKADARYNSGLFHFKEEKEQSGSADSLTLSLNVDDKVLQDILKNLYYPESPYVFREIPSDILGQVYERFLGKVIRLTAGHQAKVEEKPEVRKAGGVYYTPTYIVEYIVQNTVGKLLEGRTPRDAAKLKILDPACGSGTFPLGAYQYLLDWHLKWYLMNEPEKWLTGKNPAIYQVKDGYRLTTAKKKEILLNNIFGVDIDAQAVEVTKLSLLLKVLEGESSETIGSQLALFQERVLPDLGHNIKCGNSLIGPDYYEGHQLTMGFEGDEERYRVNAFDWRGEFSDVFIQGGFDVVVGNPPWGAEFNQDEKIYFKDRYDEFHVRTPESFNYFVGKMWKLTNSGLVGVIIPSSFLNQHEFWKTRKYLVDNTKFSRICNMGNGVFEKVTAPSCVIVFGARNKLNTSLFFDFRKFERKSLPGLLKREELGQDALNVGQDSEGYILQVRSGLGLIEKCFQWPALREIAEEVATGVSSGLDKAYVFTQEQVHSLSLESDLLRKLIIGGEIGRYWLNPVSGKKLIYTTPEVDIDKYPNTKSVLLPYREQLKLRREAANGKIPWFSLNWPRRKKLFEQSKILIRQTADHIMACLDDDGWYCLKSGLIIQLPSNAVIKYEYLLGVLNSRLIRYLYDDLVGEQARVFPEVKPVQLFKLPIRPINFTDPAEKAMHDKMVSLVERMLALHKQSPRSPQESDMVKREIESTDRAIDKLVYELYGLTEEEIKIVEGR